VLLEAGHALSVFLSTLRMQARCGYYPLAFVVHVMHKLAYVLVDLLAFDIDLVQFLLPIEGLVVGLEVYA